MLKLMKYELRKQMFSKILIALILGVLAVISTFSTIRGSQEDAQLAIMLMVTLMTIAVFYEAFECIFAYNKDLSTKQSYMLFLVPQPAYKILGAKIVAAVLQIIITIMVFLAVIITSVSFYLMKFENMKKLFLMLKSMLEELLYLDIDWNYLLESSFKFVILWLFIVMLAVFVDTLLNTILGHGKLISVLTVILYIFLFWVLVQVENQIALMNLSEVVQNIIGYGYYLLMDIVLFLGSIWLIEKKLSV